jgi:nucleoside-diphosphate-sugar epimerase
MISTILVTGATGFLGSHLVKALLKNNYRVVILKRSFSDTWRINELLSEVISYNIDLCCLNEPFEEVDKIDVIIHTATFYGRNNEDSSDILQANTIFPLHLLEASVRYGASLFLNTDTYFNKGSIPYQGLINYSLSKYQFHEWGRQFALSQKIRFTDIQLEHPFGPGDAESKFITYVIKSCLNNIKELELTYGEQKRDFIYIDDVVSAYLLLLKKADEQFEFYQSYELGTGKATSIYELVNMIHEMTNSKTILKFGKFPYSKHEIMYSKANIEKLNQLGWSSKCDLEENMRKTIAYFKSNQYIV